jgi:hypothetical protein
MPSLAIRLSINLAIAGPTFSSSRHSLPEANDSGYLRKDDRAYEYSFTITHQQQLSLSCNFDL